LFGVAVTLIGYVYTVGVQRQAEDARAVEAAALECVHTKNQLHRLWTRAITQVATHRFAQGLDSAPQMLPAGSPLPAQEARLKEIESHRRNMQEGHKQLKTWKPPAAQTIRVTDVERLVAILAKGPPEVAGPDLKTIEQFKNRLSKCPESARSK